MAVSPLGAFKGARIQANAQRSPLQLNNRPPARLAPSQKMPSPKTSPSPPRLQPPARGIEATSPPAKGVETTVVRGSTSTPAESLPNSIYEQTNPNTQQLMRRTYYDQNGKAFSREDFTQTSSHIIIIKGTRFNLRDTPHQHEERTLTAPNGLNYLKKQVRIIDHNGTPRSEWVNER